MSKLFKAKKWLTVEDAANHLAIVFGEKVTKADVLRFALDGQLKLSVNFLNGGTARTGKLVPIGEATYERLPMLIGDGFVRIYGGPSIYTDGVESHIVELDADVVGLSGVYDLPMIGGEKLDVEHRFQALTGGPGITMQTLDGSFVESDKGVICQLQEDFDDNENEPGSIAALKNIKQHIAKKRLKEPEAEKLLAQHAEDRQKFLAKETSSPRSERFYPAGNLPNDCAYVVRTAALTNFVQSVNEEPATTEKPLGTKEGNTLLTIIAALAKWAKLDYREAGKTALFIEGLTAELGAHVSKRAIEEHLKKIPNALESRMK